MIGDAYTYTNPFRVMWASWIVLFAIFCALAVDEPRTYHRVTVAGLHASKHTHVEVHGLVTMVRREEDGDVHLRLTAGGAWCVAEIIPSIPQAVPRVGDHVIVRGIHRWDAVHRWDEIHPVETITVDPWTGSQQEH